MKHQAGMIGILFLIIIGLFLLRKKISTTTSVHMTTTTAGMQGLTLQDCVADDGSIFQWPVTSGPCPKLSTAS